jgi:hypothetical protein
MMANSLITPDWITKESARILVNELQFANNINRDYDDQYRQAGAKMGDTVKARLPQRFRTTKGQALQVQAINDQFVPVTLTDQANVGISFSSAELTMDVDMYRERYIKPASEQLANTIDYDGLSRLYKDVYNAVGTPATAASSNLTYLTAGVKLTNGACPKEGRVAVLDPLSNATIANANVAVFNPQSQISGMFRSGRMSATNALGIAKWYEDQNVARHTSGAYTTATPEVLGANQTGSSLITDGWASGASNLTQGDIFTIEGVYAVNPQNYASTGALQQFVVTQALSDTAGAMTISISPSIITSGQLQTVTASPADNADIFVIGATTALTSTVSSQSLIFHKDAFTMVMADLVMPEGGALASRVSDNELGVALRFARQWNIQTDQNAARLDCLYGFKTIRPELACRVYGA